MSVSVDFPLPGELRPAGNARRRITVVLGTRPEAIKLAPVILALRRCVDLETVLVATGQHRKMLDQVLSRFSLVPDVDLDLMLPGQCLNGLTRRVLEAMDRSLGEIAPDLLVVQGDTTTTFAASLAAFYRRIPVAHVEAGLRSDDVGNPFPEEVNRRLTSVLTAIHFASTPLAGRRLRAEGLPASRVVVTGNTVVDALEMLLDVPFDPAGTPVEELLGEAGRILLVTSHRRESWGRDLESICLALRDLAGRFPDVRVVYPVHLNPRVRDTARMVLSGVPRVHLVPPLDYLTFIHLMKASHLILTDSGGIQEEAPTLGKPLLLLRKVTERPEAFTAGAARIVGARRDTIVHEAARLLSDHEAYSAMANVENPYGDGRAAGRIVEALRRWSRGAEPLLAAERQFQPRLKEVAA